MISGNGDRSGRVLRNILTRFLPASSNDRFFLSFLVTLILIDLVFFRTILWRIPDETAWQEQPHYHFEYEYRDILRKRDEYDSAVILAGSSIALYGIFPEMLKEGLTHQRNGDPQPDSNQKLMVRHFAHQGMNTMNLLANMDRLLSLRPTLVVLPINFVDFRLERPVELELLDALDSGYRREALSLLEKDLVHYGNYLPVAPGGMLGRFGSSMSIAEKGDALMHMAFAFYRYRDMAQIPVSLYIYNRAMMGRSYSQYAGVPIGAGGVHHTGWTAPVFEFVMNHEMRNDRQLMQYDSVKPGEIRIRRGECGRNGVEIYRQVLHGGWNRMKFSSLEETWIGRNGKAEEFSVCATVDPPVLHVKENTLVGVRLTRNFGRTRPARSAGRELRREDELYLHQSSDEYDASFRERVLKFDRSGMEYLHALKKAKEVYAKRPFDEEYPTFQYFEEIRQALKNRGIPLLVVNAPENPLSLSLYGESPWYGGYLEFLGRGDRSLYRFVDASRIAPKNEFYDYHHLSYYGSRRFTQMMIKEIASFLKYCDTDGCDSGEEE